jgi:hypothetical protein
MKFKLISVSPAGYDLASHNLIASHFGLDDAAVKDKLGDLDLSEVKPPSLVRLFGESGEEAVAWLRGKGQVSSDASVIGYADAVIIQENESPIAISVLPQAIQASLAIQNIRIEFDGAGLIVGAVGLARAIAASLAKLGLKRIFIVDPDDQATKNLVASLSRRLVGIQFEALSRARLTQIPAEASVAVNLVEFFDDSILEESILEDVSYMNFLRPGGVWIDWTGASGDRGFADEIANAGVQVFDPLNIRRRRDALLVSKLTRHRAEDVYAGLADSPVSLPD